MDDYWAIVVNFIGHFNGCLAPGKTTAYRHEILPSEIITVQVVVSQTLDCNLVDLAGIFPGQNGTALRKKITQINIYGFSYFLHKSVMDG